MKVGIIVDHQFDTPLGYSVRPRELSINLSKLGCEVNVFSPVDRSLKYSENLIVHGISSSRLLITERIHKLLRKISKNRQTARLLYRKKALEALSRQLAQGIYGMVRDSGVDLLQGEKEIAGRAAVILGQKLGVPVVTDVHGLLAEEALLYQFIKEGSKEYQECREFVSEVLRGSNAVITVSDVMRTYFQKEFNIGGGRLFVVENAARATKITRPSRAAPKNLVYAGIFEPWERVDIAIASMSHVRSAHKTAKFFVAGSGSLESALVRYVDHLGIRDYVNFVGSLPYREVPHFLAQGDIAVLPSTQDIVREVACPIKLFEYLAAGLPVVTVEGLWWSRLVRDNNAGLVSDGDPKAFGGAINSLLSDPDKLNRMGQEGVRLVKHKHNWTERAERLLRIYEEIV